MYVELQPALAGIFRSFLASAVRTLGSLCNGPISGVCRIKDELLYTDFTTIVALYPPEVVLWHCSLSSAASVVCQVQVLPAARTVSPPFGIGRLIFSVAGSARFLVHRWVVEHVQLFCIQCLSMSRL